MTDREVAQSAGTAPERGRVRRVRRFVANRSYPTKLGVLAVVLVLAATPFGALRSAADEDTKPLKLGQRIDLGPFYLTIESVKQLTELPPVIEADPTSRFLVIKATLTNHTDRPESNHLVTLALSGKHTGAMAFDEDAQPRLHVYDVDDAGEVPDGEMVNPHLTYTYAYVLRQSPDTDLDALTLAVTGYHFVADDPETLDPDEWVADDHPLAEGHVDIVVGS